MTIYAVGDIQGCIDELKTLIDTSPFDWKKDTLWVAGDLVNRGPGSLEVLEYLYAHRDRVQIVLGNHDLHLLAIEAGFKTPKSGDTLQPILDATHRYKLFNWLLAQPLLHVDHKRKLIMSHAGLPPCWSLQKAIACNAEIMQVLQSPSLRLEFFEHMYGNKPKKWKDSLVAPDRWRVITNYFTRMRFCDHSGKLDLKNKSDIPDKEKGMRPWFNWVDEQYSDWTVLFGHWASLNGKTHLKHIVGLDTGCVWGGHLTLYNTETTMHYQIPGLDQ